MNKLLQGLKEEQNYVPTENGAEAYSSTLDACLDMFGSFGAMRFDSDSKIIRTFELAFNENREKAMRMLFYFRDIRGGQGTRRQFRVILNWLAENHSWFVLNNLDNIIFFGRGDDYLCLLTTSLRVKVADYLVKKLNEDYNKMLENKTDVSLLAKWLPSENTSSAETKNYARFLIQQSGMTPKQYRQKLSKLRAYLNVVEVKMSAQKWTEINYETLPSRAAMNYSDAFFKHDEEGYSKYILDIANGDAKVNAGALYPVDIVHKCYDNLYNCTRKDIILNNAMWASLPNYFEGKEESSICVVDTSGSMSGIPLEVALSLGLYCAERCNGPFKNHFFTFSSRPKLQEIIGANIYEKLNNMDSSDWEMNTNLEAVFDLILNTAINNHCSQNELPSKLYIISDMQFDQARENSWRGVHPKPFMQQMKQKFTEAGYIMPAIVYWNVRASKCGMFQETFEGENCCMVSGYSPSLFESIIKGTTYIPEEFTFIDEETGEVTVEVGTKQVLDPLTIMNTTIDNERYDVVWCGK